MRQVNGVAHMRANSAGHELLTVAIRLQLSQSGDLSSLEALERRRIEEKCSQKQQACRCPGQPVRVKADGAERPHDQKCRKNKPSPDGQYPNIGPAARSAPARDERMHDQPEHWNRAIPGTGQHCEHVEREANGHELRLENRSGHFRITMPTSSQTRVGNASNSHPQGSPSRRNSRHSQVSTIEFSIRMRAAGARSRSVWGRVCV